MSRKFNVAIVQTAPVNSELDIELRKGIHTECMAGYINLISATNPTVDMIVFPELLIPGGFDPNTWLESAETLNGPSMAAMCEMAVQSKKWIIPGSFFEKTENGEGAYNTTVLINPEGKIVLKYRKVFIPYPLDPAVPGNEFPVYEIPGIGKIGLMICADGHAPEIARNLVMNGAEVIIKPTMHPTFIGNVRNHVSICQARAIENQCFMISVNQSAPGGLGHSCVCDPEGRIVEELGDGEGFIVVSIDFDEVRRVRENGSFGLFQFLKLAKHFKDIKIPIDQCYRDGFEKCQLYEDMSKEKNF